MNKIVILALLSVLTFAVAAQAQMACQVLSNGVIYCLPAGGGGSSYR